MGQTARATSSQKICCQHTCLLILLLAAAAAAACLLRRDACCCRLQLLAVACCRRPLTARVYCLQSTCLLPAVAATYVLLDACCSCLVMLALRIVPSTSTTPTRNIQQEPSVCVFLCAPTACARVCQTNLARIELATFSV